MMKDIHCFRVGDALLLTDEQYTAQSNKTLCRNNGMSICHIFAAASMLPFIASIYIYNFKS
ncbi:hypothetical protein B9T26_09265 [Acinetobacter sp. ANC 4169]|nr:hypothetical protein B9T26_09265 [Acinetobacter sp. ANC 4169]